MKKQNNDFIDKGTGEIMEGKLNQVIIVETRRPDGSLRVAQDYKYCPTMAEQHTAHLTNINYLMERYKPDELAAYIAARSQYRQEILGHDFSVEPNLQEANNVIYKSKQAFSELPEEFQNQFKSHLEFLKYIDNPANAETLIKLGLATKKQIEQIKIPDQIPNTSTPLNPNQNLQTQSQTQQPPKT